MKRRCSAKDLLELMLYESVPSSIFAVEYGSRPRLLGIETDALEVWTGGLSQYKTTVGNEEQKFAEEVDYAHQLARKRREDNKEFGEVNLFDYSADGLPNFEVRSGLHEFEQNIDPKSLKVNKEEDEYFE